MNRKRKILLMGGLAVGLILLVIALMPSPVPVSAVILERGVFIEYVEEEGRTSLRDPHILSAPIGGYLQRVTLEPGDSISAGQVLFRLEPPPAPALDRRSREQAIEAVGAARARLDVAEAELEVASKHAAFATRELERNTRLREQNVISASDLDRVRNEKDRADGLERAAGRMVEAARFELRNAQAVLEVTEGARSSGERSQLEIRSPEDGVILRRHRWNEGSVQAGEDILGVGNLSHLEVTVDLLSMDAVRVEPGMRVVLTRWGGNRDLPARVRRVEPSGFTRVSALGVDEQRVPVLVTVDAEREEWRQLGEGYRVEARFILWESEDVLRVPTSSLFRHEDAWAAYVVEGNRAVLRVVEPGRRSGLWTQVLSGLEAGERVVTHPGERVEDGVRVRAEIRDHP